MTARDPKYLIGILVWTNWNGRLQPQIFWSDKMGERPKFDSATKPRVVAQHDLFYDLCRWSLEGAAQVHPAPAVMEAV